MIEFHVGDVVNSCKYRYSGYKILHYASGKKGVRYLFECPQGDANAPKFVQFSDHIIGPRKSQHFHIFMGNESQEALLKRWITGRPIIHMRCIKSRSLMRCCTTRTGENPPTGRPGERGFD